MAKKAKSGSRNSSGMGSVRQRKDGRWEARYSAPNGQQKSVYASSEAEVTRKLREKLHEIDVGSWREPSRLTVKDWLDLWLKDYCGHTKESTRRSYKYLVKLHICPVIGAVKLEKLSPVHIRRVYAAMIEHGKSPKYIGLARSVLIASLNAARQDKILRENVAESVQIPKSEKKEMHIIDKPSIPAFVEAASHQTYGNAIVMLLLTGLRTGELRGLQWSDIDWDSQTIHIRRQLHLQADKLIFTLPKDRKKRDLVVTPEVMDLLKRQKKLLAQWQLMAGEKWIAGDHDDLVFRLKSGRCLGESSLYWAVKMLSREIGVEGLHPHDLRHSYAVAALRSGIDVKTVQHNLGHASAAMTLDIYAAYTSDAGREAAEKLSKWWKNALV